MGLNIPKNSFKFIHRIQNAKNILNAYFQSWSGAEPDAFYEFGTMTYSKLNPTAGGILITSYTTNILDTADYLRSENVKVKAGDILNIEWNDINIAGNENRYKIMLIPDDVSNPSYFIDGTASFTATPVDPLTSLLDDVLVSATPLDPITTLLDLVPVNATPLEPLTTSLDNVLDSATPVEPLTSSLELILVSATPVDATTPLLDVMLVTATPLELIIFSSDKMLERVLQDFVMLQQNPITSLWVTTVMHVLLSRLLGQQFLIAVTSAFLDLFLMVEVSFIILLQLNMPLRTVILMN